MDDYAESSVSPTTDSMQLTAKSRCMEKYRNFGNFLRLSILGANLISFDYVIL